MKIGSLGELQNTKHLPLLANLSDYYFITDYIFIFILVCLFDK